jgi:hypothetical protein
MSDTPSTDANTETPRVIENMAVLDLSTAKDAGELKNISAIKNVAVVLIPEELAGALASIRMENVAGVIPVATGANLKLLIGQIKLTGEALAAAKEDEIWIIAGQAHITTSVENFTGRELQIYGHVFAPRGSEAALAGAITKMQGQINYVPAEARLLMGDESWGREFFELLPKPSAFFIMGHLSIEGDVTVDLLKEKVTEIALVGHIEAPKSLVPLLQVLTVENLGQISAKE